MIEREIKLAAEAGIVLPDLADVVPGITVGPKTTLQLAAVYYDTSTLSLARWGVTLRSRSGEAGPVWTLKVPITSSDSELSRHEFVFDEPTGAVPPAVSRATRAFVRSQTLGPVVRLQTDRTQYVVELNGHPLAILCDDMVLADGDAEPISVFREIEIELIDTPSASVVAALISRLRSAGCKDDEAPVPKALRALGPRAFDPPDVIVPKAGKRATVGLLVRHPLAKSVTQLIRQHAKICAGDDPEDLHQFREAVRRLRADLRTFAPLLDGEMTTWLRDELGWLASEVGVGSEADVVADRLRNHVARLSHHDARSVVTLLQRLALATTEACEHVVTTLAEARYIALLDALVETAGAPRFATEPPGLADRAGRPIFSEIIRKRWRRLSRAVDALTPDDPGDAYDAIRILAKRARYASEAVSPLYGTDARRFARALTDVQTVLGNFEDTIVTEAWLRRAAKALPSTRLVAGELIALERADRVELRARFKKVWAKTSRRKLRKWLT